jgi:hypothetical protein
MLKEPQLMKPALLEHTVPQYMAAWAFTMQLPTGEDILPAMYMLMAQ